MRSLRVVSGLVSAVVVGGLLVPSAAAVSTGSAGAGTGSVGGSGGVGSGVAGSQRPGLGAYRITLVTGDVAELSVLPGGKKSARLVSDKPYYLGEFDGELTLIPIEAYPMYVQGTLDKRLFNLSLLAAQGYDDAKTNRLPLLLTAPENSTKSTPQAPQASTLTRSLPASGLTAISVAKSKATEFWQGISGANFRTTGASKLWLDGRNQATLERSVKQIAAPEAWKQGFTGAGVKVAVLDTGVDAAHPDLQKQIVGQASFIPGEAVQDHHGHGTHVASIVAGLGQAQPPKAGAGSPAVRKGVAPGAKLLVGKVLDNAGSGMDSEVIAGMEWAVAQGAKVVNLSLGGLPSDGTDPLSAAVDRLSQESEALFVIAAGNSGAEESVASPGAASEALTVGAVDSEDKLAWFSSRGPRRGDGAMKPEVTAPGSAIAAARAAGTNGGHLLGEHYTAMSGTSMATPHVAGAAAIVAQKNPTWTGQQIKAALAATAVPMDDATPAEEGLGRIDVPRAANTRILPDAATLGFGDLTWTGTATPAPVTRKVAYRNTSAVPMTLDLAVQAKSPAGVPAALTVSPAKLTIAPGQTGTAAVTLDRAKTSPGKYSGDLVARGKASGPAGDGYKPGSTFRVGLGFAAGGRMHQVTVKAVDRTGAPAAGDWGGPSGVQLWNQSTGDVEAIVFDETGSRTLEVPTGRYSVMAFVMGGDEANWTNAVALLGDPDALVDRDRVFTFDARKTHKVTVKTPRRADPQTVGIAWHRKTGTRQAVSGWLYGQDAANGITVQDFGKVADGTFQVVQRWDLVEPKLTVDVSGSGQSFRLPTPREGSYQTDFVGTETVPLYNAGDGSAEELKGAAGKVALIRWRHYEQTAGQVAAAKAAGARAVFMYNENPGFWGDGAEVGIPFYRLFQPEGKRLLDLLGQGNVDLKLTGLRDSTYAYDLAVAPSRVSGPLTYDFARMRPAQVTATFNRNDAWYGHLDERTAYLPGLSTGLTAARAVNGPVVRTDYLATDVQGAEWDEKTAAGEWNESGIEFTVGRGYRPGERASRQVWEPLRRPATPDASGSEPEGWPAARFENALRITMPQYVNGDRSVYGWGDLGDTTTLKLSSNGTELGRADWSIAQFPLPAKQAWYDLTLDVRRGPDSWAKTSTATQTTWRFRSGPTKTRAVLPLIQVDYRLNGNRLGLSTAYQPGFRGFSLFHTTAEYSLDGKTWHRLPLAPRGLNRSEARLPAHSKPLSLRVTASDLTGNRLTQTIEKAIP